jgi:hypothetical protein
LANSQVSRRPIIPILHRALRSVMISTMITAATIAQTPSALMIKPKKLISSLSDDMRSSPLKEHESFRRTIYLCVDLVSRQQGICRPLP